MSAEDVELLNSLNPTVCMAASGVASWKRPRVEALEDTATAKSVNQKKAERKERNRLSAERHRKKQREYTEQLECVLPDTYLLLFGIN